MSPEQMLPGKILLRQMALWQLESVLDVPGNLILKFHQNRISDSWDIADIEFVWVGGVGFAKQFSCQTQLRLNCRWVELGFDNKLRPVSYEHGTIQPQLLLYLIIPLPFCWLISCWVHTSHHWSDIDIEKERFVF